MSPLLLGRMIWALWVVFKTFFRARSVRHSAISFIVTRHIRLWQRMALVPVSSQVFVYIFSPLSNLSGLSFCEREGLGFSCRDGFMSSGFAGPDRHPGYCRAEPPVKTIIYIYIYMAYCPKFSPFDFEHSASRSIKSALHEYFSTVLVSLTFLEVYRCFFPHIIAKANRAPAYPACGPGKERRGN